MSGTGASILQILGYLCLLVGIFAAAVLWLRNGASLFQPKNKGTRKLEISETRMLGNRQFLVVAEYEGKKLLIGVCPGRIDYLCRLDEGEADDGRFSEILPEKPE